MRTTASRIHTPRLLTYSMLSPYPAPLSLPPTLQESLEDMGTTASRIGTSLLSSLAFAKFKGSVKARGEGLEAGEDVAGGSSSTSLVLAAEGSQQVLVLAGEASGELPLGEFWRLQGGREGWALLGEIRG